LRHVKVPAPEMVQGSRGSELEGAMHPVQTLIVLANEHAARLFWNRGVGHGLEAGVELVAADFPDTDVRHADRPGRNTPGPGLAPHAFDHHESERAQERRRFAAHVAGVVAAASGEADRVILAAAPRMLGVLREALPQAVRARIAAELDKDLLKTPIADLPAHFEAVLAL
jgi:protein required for attachment to host cells